jgi:hypothetical protein
MMDKDYAPLTAHLRKMATAVYICAPKEAADDISAGLMEAARRLEAAEAKRDALGEHAVMMEAAFNRYKAKHLAQVEGGFCPHCNPCRLVDKLSAAEAEIARLWKPGVYYHCPACNHPTPVSDILNAAEVVDARQREGSTGTPGKAHIVKFR